MSLQSTTEKPTVELQQISNCSGAYKYRTTVSLLLFFKEPQIKCSTISCFSIFLERLRNMVSCTNLSKQLNFISLEGLSSNFRQSRNMRSVISHALLGCTKTTLEYLSNAQGILNLMIPAFIEASMLIHHGHYLVL